MADKRTSDAPLYYARGHTVMKRPVVNASGGTTMGFRVCDANEYVEGEEGTAADIIADALNRLPLLAAQVAELEREVACLKAPHRG